MNEFFSETLRYWAPLWRNRRAKEVIALPGVTIPSGGQIDINLHSARHDPEASPIRIDSGWEEDIRRRLPSAFGQHAWAAGRPAQLVQFATLTVRLESLLRV